MPKNILKFFIIAGLLVTAGVAKADDGFSFSYQNQSFAVPEETLNQWQGRQILESSTVLSPAEPKFKDQLADFTGQGQLQNNYQQIYNYKLGSIYNYVNTLGGQINSPETEAALKIENGRATDFTPPQTGQKIDAYKTAMDALTALQLGKGGSPLTVYTAQPQTELSQTNNLGINELIGEGVSNFKGSPNNRRHNIAVGLEKFKGIIIPQGATFSFDDNLGPVTAEAGFLPELVIDNGTTLPELGGGLCQVSTTTFRAAMAAGLPITDRRNHAYAVSYYSPQGTDATIYPGSADLKFVNNTPGAILIWPYEKDSNTLVFDFYGTKDGRQVTLEKPVQYDRKPDGSMKADWTRVVLAADGQTSTSTFHSVYQPPALFHKTETFVPAASSTTPSGLQAPKVN